jgi:hypothetical protein
MEERLDGRALEATKAAHDALLSAYASVLDEVAPIPSGRELTERLGLRPSYVVDRPFLPLVRYLVEAHASRQLRELHSVYVRLQHGRTPAFSDPNGQAWLRQAAADVAGLVETLPRRKWLWDTLLAVLTLVPASALVWLSQPHWKLDALFLVLLGIGVLMVCALAVTLGAIDGSYDAKQKLFGAPSPGQRRRRRDSVYEREDVLFEVLGRSKRREIPLDKMVPVFTLLVFAGVGVTSAANGFRMDNLVGGIGWIAITVGFLVWAAVLARKALHQSPRL